MTFRLVGLGITALFGFLVLLMAGYLITAAVLDRLDARRELRRFTARAKGAMPVESGNGNHALSDGSIPLLPLSRHLAEMRRSGWMDWN